MQLSIVIPTFNEADNIGQLVAYLRQHTENTSTEIMVVNACKTSDNTAELARAAGAIVYECTNCSRAAQMNYGASLAKGDILYFVHADVLPPKSFYSDIQKNLSEGIDWGWFSYAFDSSKWALRVNSYYTRFDGLFAGGGDQTLFIRKPVFFTLGQFSEKYVIMEDFDFVRRAKKTTYNRTIIPSDVIVSARKYEQNHYVRVNLVNFLMFIMFLTDCSQERMKRWYGRLLN